MKTFKEFVEEQVFVFKVQTPKIKEPVVLNQKAKNKSEAIKIIKGQVKKVDGKAPKTSDFEFIKIEEPKPTKPKSTAKKFRQSMFKRIAKVHELIENSMKEYDLKDTSKDKLIKLLHDFDRIVNNVTDNAIK